MLESWQAITAMHGAFHDMLFATMLCSARLFALFSIFQGTASKILQGRARSGIVILLAAFVAAGQPTDLLHQLNGPDLFVLGLKEAFIGVVLGYIAATVFWTAEGVGALIDNVAGYNSVQQQNPLSSNSSTPISTLLLQLCITIFYILGGFLLLVETVFETYRWWPITSYIPIPAVLLERLVLSQTDTLMTQIIKIASPILVVMVLIDLGFGLIAKTAGKLEPNSLAQPVKSGTAVLVVLLSLTLFVQQLSVSLSLADLKAQLHAWSEFAIRTPK